MSNKYNYCSGLTSIKIPDGVTSIGGRAFRKCSGLVSIKIPDGVTSIGSCAFDECSSLVSINIPNGITSIPFGLLWGCSGLTSIKIPDGVTSIGGSAFQSCSGLTSIKIPDGVTSIGDYAFCACRGLTSIKIPDGVTSIGGYAFSGCSGLTSINIPDGVTSIGSCAFNSCSGLTSIKIPDGVTSIGSSAFSGCGGLTSINIPDGVTSIGSSAFSGCGGLTSIKVPDGVTSFQDGVFSYCGGLTSIKIPDGVTSIGSYAFRNCGGLTSIKIPDGVTSIGKGAFYDCRSLTSISFPKNITDLGTIAFQGCNINEVSISSLNSWIKFNFTEDMGLNNYDLIVNGLKLTDLVVPEEITTVGKYAFKGCTSLESITFHKDVELILQNAFNGCTNVKKITCQGSTPPTCGVQAFDGISRTNCVLYVPESSGSDYKNATPWSEFTNIVGGGTDTPATPETCQAPTISLDNDTKQLIFESSTPGAKYHYTITCDDMADNRTSTDGVLQMLGVYDITAYASADGMFNSEMTTAKLLWVNVEMDNTGIDAVSVGTQRGVIVSASAGSIRISGTKGGEPIAIYTTGGTMLCSLTADEGNTVVSGLPTGAVYIVEIGGTSAKVAF